MKYLRAVPLLVLFLVTVYFAIFNWRVFIVSLDVSTGVGSVRLPLVAAVFLVGMLFLGLQTGLTYLMNLSRNTNPATLRHEVQFS